MRELMPMNGLRRNDDAIKTTAGIIKTIPARLFEALLQKSSIGNAAVTRVFALLQKSIYYLAHIIFSINGKNLSL